MIGVAHRFFANERWVIIYAPLSALRSPRLILIYMPLTETYIIDWTDCPLVECVPGKVSGVPILKHSRVQADSIVENFESGSPVEEIADNFEIPEDTIRAVLSYAAAHKQQQP